MQIMTTSQRIWKKVYTMDGLTRKGIYSKIKKEQWCRLGPLFCFFIKREGCQTNQKREDCCDDRNNCGNQTSH